MEKFRLLYFEGNLLDRSVDLEVRDLLEAIDAATVKPPHQRIEIWSGVKRVAEVGPALRC